MFALFSGHPSRCRRPWVGSLHIPLTSAGSDLVGASCPSRVVAHSCTTSGYLLRAQSFLGAPLFAGFAAHTYDMVLRSVHTCVASCSALTVCVATRAAFGLLLPTVFSTSQMTPSLRAPHVRVANASCALAAACCALSSLPFVFSVLLWVPGHPTLQTIFTPFFVVQSMFARWSLCAHCWYESS